MLTADLFRPYYPTRRVAVYAGYSFGMERAAERAGLLPWLTGVVVTPKWARRCAREVTGHMSRHVIIDNGAYPAWRDGRELTLAEQVDGIRAAMEHLDPEWIVLPDVVADARASWWRTLAGAADLEDVGLHRTMVVAQDGMRPEDVAALAAELGAGVFIGGSDWAFKSRMMHGLAALDVRHVHVGRASQPTHIEACCEIGAQSCDSTSYLRQQKYNTERTDEWRALFERAALQRAVGDVDVEQCLVGEHGADAHDVADVPALEASE